LLRQTRQPLFKRCGASLKTAILSQRIKQFRGFRNPLFLICSLTLTGRSLMSGAQLFSQRFVLIS
jgi:hypothetical protein